jgi:hypothetical protein
VNPPAGLDRTAGFLHGVANSSLLYRLIASAVHGAQGTSGEWGQPGNNPINHPENFANATSPVAALNAPGQSPTGPGAVSGDPTDPNNPGAYSLTPTGGSQPAVGPPQAQPNISPIAALLSYMQGTEFGGGGGSPLQALQAFRNSRLTLPSARTYNNPQVQDPNYYQNDFNGFISPSAFIDGSRSSGGGGGWGRSAGFLVA